MLKNIFGKKEKTKEKTQEAKVMEMKEAVLKWNKSVLTVCDQIDSLNTRVTEMAKKMRAY